MKKAFITLGLLAVMTAGCADDNNTLHVKMNCKNVGDTIIVMVTDDNRQTFTGKQGVFDFNVNIPQPTKILLAEPAVFRGDRSAKYYQIPAVGGEEVILTQKDESRYDIDGSTFYSQYHKADLFIEEAQKEVNDFTQQMQQLMASGTPQEEVMKRYQEGIEPIQERFTSKLMTYIKEHANEEATTAVIPQLDDLDKMKEAVALLTPAVRDGRCKMLYQEIIDMTEAQQKAEAEAAQKQAAGAMAPDFTLNDINGKPLALSSLRGKYVILDFWGSWCGWCIKGFPEMKEYYNKYKGKFEILGIDCNDTEAKWKEAVAKHELPWLHVYNPRDSKVLADYGIQGFPTKIVVGPDGKIVKTIVGEDPAFYTLLDQLFGGK